LVGEIKIDVKRYRFIFILNKNFFFSEFKVEVDHKCDLNTARSYVVYSALGSFYIPGVVMIFVYIRIFMVVYDRENLIKKFHNNYNPPSNISLKSTQNSTINNPNTIEIKNKKNNFTKFSTCCCFCFQKQTPQLSKASNIEQKQNGYLVYRFTTNNNKYKFTCTIITNKF
jgi:hypothetical protein